VWVPHQNYANPVDVALSDLAVKHRTKTSKSDVWQSFTTLLRGDEARGNVRTAVCSRASGPNGVAPRCASAQEQAACLVDLATDANVLGRMWKGWRPWL
jgi:hypothetical protein